MLWKRHAEKDDLGSFDDVRGDRRLGVMHLLVCNVNNTKMAWQRIDFAFVSPTRSRELPALSHYYVIQ